MNLDNKLKMVETGSTVFQTNIVRTTNIINVNNLKYTKADRTDLTVRPYGNLFSSFNLPITNQQQSLFNSGGTFSNTAISDINVDEVIIIEIPKNQYGELIDGKTIKVTLPIVSGGTNVGIDCYGTYFTDSSQNLNNSNNNLSDATAQAAYFGITPTGDNDYNSNIVFLFSNFIKPPQLNTGTTWNQWTTAYKYNTNSPLNSLSNKQFAVFSPNLNPNNNTADEVVGIAYLDKGFFVITHPQLVNNFAYSAGTSSGYDNITSGTTYTGNDTFTQIYFNSTTLSNASFTSIKTEFVQNIIAFAMPNEFYESENPTFLETYIDGNPNNEPVYITEIGLYNANKELIAIAKTSEPIPKNKFNLINFQIQLTL
jgi:hypothetical protein